MVFDETKGPVVCPKENEGSTSSFCMIWSWWLVQKRLNLREQTKVGWCFPYLWDFEMQAPKAFLGPRLQTLEQESWVYIWEMLVSLISLKESAIGNENAQSVVPELLTSSIHYLFTKIIFFNCFIFGQLHLRTFSSSKIPIHPKFLLFGSRRAT